MLNKNLSEVAFKHILSLQYDELKRIFGLNEDQFFSDHEIEIVRYIPVLHRGWAFDVHAWLVCFRGKKHLISTDHGVVYEMKRMELHDYKDTLKEIVHTLKEVIENE